MFVSLREFLTALENDERMRGQLCRVATPVDKAWEIAAVTRLAIQRFRREWRPALLFERVRGYEMPVVVGALFNPTKYAYALGCSPAEILERWLQALRRPLQPVLVSQGPCQEVVRQGTEANFFDLPIPVWTPGYDAAPYLTGNCVISRDPETGARNVGTYRMQVKGERRAGLGLHSFNHGHQHLLKYEKLGRPMPVAVAIGCDPSVAMTSVAKLELGDDELALAGGLRGAPVELVRCRTIDLEAPAHAEIILEGEVPAGVREIEGPFGEMSGYVSPAAERPIFELKCITCRSAPLLQAYGSQKPPSESANLRGIANAAMVYRTLVETERLPGILDVHLADSTSAHGHVLIKMQPRSRDHVRQVLAAARRLGPRYGKIITVVDEDIDIRDAEEVDWAHSFRMQPARDVAIIEEPLSFPQDHSLAPPGTPPEERPASSKMIIDATKKWPYEPVSLPEAEAMKRAEERWREYGIGVEG
ncbi:MAG: UbiD family decarboxylase [Candidatus Tectomicrobia bacterium]|nr:UbiD family decarboxylase [Candidatus Tectomicrobia bacterium]